MLERHYPRRNTKDNISLKKVLANSGGWKWWTYRSSCLKNCNGLMISHNLTVNFVRPAIHVVLDVSLRNLYLMLITSYINRTQNFELLYLLVFEILIPKVPNVFIESPDILIYISIACEKWGARMVKMTLVVDLDEYSVRKKAILCESSVLNSSQ